MHSSQVVPFASDTWGSELLGQWRTLYCAPFAAAGPPVGNNGSGPLHGPGGAAYQMSQHGSRSLTLSKPSFAFDVLLLFGLYVGDAP